MSALPKFAVGDKVKYVGFDLAEATIFTIESVHRQDEGTVYSGRCYEGRATGTAMHAAESALELVEDTTPEGAKS